LARICTVSSLSHVDVSGRVSLMSIPLAVVRAMRD
jgi:hypothetical protein